MTINSSQLKYILKNTPASQNIMLVGKHGIGKSRILEEYFKGCGQKVVTLFLGQMSDPGDLIGLPQLDKESGRTDFSLPYWFPTDGKPVVLFLDELNRARPELLQTVMDLTLNRKLAGKSLPEGSRIISAVNGGGDYQLTDLDPALVSRFNIYDFAPSVEDWICWARGAGLDSRILSFIEENPEFLDGGEKSSFYGDSNLERSPDRRSWERASNIIKDFEVIGKNEEVLLSGIVGDRAAAVFFEYLNSHRLPSVSALLLDGFTRAQKQLEDLKLTELTQLNESLFRWLEKTFREQKPEKEQKQEDSVIAENLTDYFDWLAASGKKELQAHFVSLISAASYPHALNFIYEKARTLYQKLLDLSSEL